MVEFSAATWVVLGVLSVGGVLGVLHALAGYVGNQKLAHDTHAKVVRLRKQYVAELSGEQPADGWDIQIVGDGPPSAPLKDAA